MPLCTCHCMCWLNGHFFLFECLKCCLAVLVWQSFGIIDLKPWYNYKWKKPPRGSWVLSTWQIHPCIIIQAGNNKHELTASSFLLWRYPLTIDEVLITKLPYFIKTIWSSNNYAHTKHDLRLTNWLEFCCQIKLSSIISDTVMVVKLLTGHIV